MQPNPTHCTFLNVSGYQLSLFKISKKTFLLDFGESLKSLGRDFEGVSKAV